MTIFTEFCKLTLLFYSHCLTLAASINLSDFIEPTEMGAACDPLVGPNTHGNGICNSVTYRRSCREYYLAGYDVSTIYWINPRGNRQPPQLFLINKTIPHAHVQVPRWNPFQVRCDMKHDGLTSLLVEDAKLSEGFPLKGYQEPRLPYPDVISIKIPYLSDGDTSVEALVRHSASCSQSVWAECKGRNGFTLDFGRTDFIRTIDQLDLPSDTQQSLNELCTGLQSDDDVKRVEFTVSSPISQIAVNRTLDSPVGGTRRSGFRLGLGPLVCEGQRKRDAAKVFSLIKSEDYVSVVFNRNSTTNSVLSFDQLDIAFSFRTKVDNGTLLSVEADDLDRRLTVSLLGGRYLSVLWTKGATLRFLVNCDHHLHSNNWQFVHISTQSGLQNYLTVQVRSELFKFEVNQTNWCRDRVRQISYGGSPVIGFNEFHGCFGLPSTSNYTGIYDNSSGPLCLSEDAAVDGESDWDAPGCLVADQCSKTGIEKNSVSFGHLLTRQKQGFLHFDLTKAKPWSQLSLSFRTYQQNGLILWHKQRQHRPTADSGGLRRSIDFTLQAHLLGAVALVITECLKVLENGHIKCRFCHLTKNSGWNTMEWVSLSLQKSGEVLFAQADDQYCSLSFQHRQEQFPEDLVDYIRKQDEYTILFLGGFPSDFGDPFHQFHGRIERGSHEQFQGCIANLHVDGELAMTRQHLDDAKFNYDLADSSGMTLNGCKPLGQLSANFRPQCPGNNSIIRQRFEDADFEVQGANGCDCSHRWRSNARCDVTVTPTVEYPIFEYFTSPGELNLIRNIKTRLDEFSSQVSVASISFAFRLPANTCEGRRYPICLMSLTGTRIDSISLVLSCQEHFVDLQIVSLSERSSVPEEGFIARLQRFDWNFVRMQLLPETSASKLMFLVNSDVKIFSSENLFGYDKEMLLLKDLKKINIGTDCDIAGGGRRRRTIDSKLLSRHFTGTVSEFVINFRRFYETRVSLLESANSLQFDLIQFLLDSKQKVKFNVTKGFTVADIENAEHSKTILEFKRKVEGVEYPEPIPEEEHQANRIDQASWLIILAGVILGVIFAFVIILAVCFWHGRRQKAYRRAPTADVTPMAATSPPGYNHVNGAGNGGRGENKTTVDIVDGFDDSCRKPKTVIIEKEQLNHKIRGNNQHHHGNSVGTAGGGRVWLPQSAHNPLHSCQGALDNRQLSPDPNVAQSPESPIRPTREVYLQQRNGNVVTLNGAKPAGLQRAATPPEDPEFDTLEGTLRRTPSAQARAKTARCSEFFDDV